MPIVGEYEPSTSQWVADQVAEYEASGGTRANTLRDTGIPVVIVTSLERDEEKAEGIDAGADAYITKSVFNQDTLLDTVERLIR